MSYVYSSSVERARGNIFSEREKNTYRHRHPPLPSALLGLTNTRLTYSSATNVPYHVLFCHANSHPSHYPSGANCTRRVIDPSSRGGRAGSCSALLLLRHGVNATSRRAISTVEPGAWLAASVGHKPGAVGATSVGALRVGVRFRAEATAIIVRGGDVGVVTPPPAPNIVVPASEIPLNG